MYRPEPGAAEEGFAFRKAKFVSVLMGASGWGFPEEEQKDGIEPVRCQAIRPVNQRAFGFEALTGV